MKEGMLWRTGVMEGPCAVARGKDINILRPKAVVTPAFPSLSRHYPVYPGFNLPGYDTQMSLAHLGKQGQTPSEAAPSKRRCLSQVKLKATPGIEGCALRQVRAVPSKAAGTTIGQLALCPGGGDGSNSWLHYDISHFDSSSNRERSRI